MVEDNQGNLPISVIVVTKDEEANISRCLASLVDFDEIIVVDSGSSDRTLDLARLGGARVIDFTWDGCYPKKRQWCLDNLELVHNWVFFIDADEVATDEMVAEMRGLNFGDMAGYFISGLYVVGEQILRHGLRNNKLCLLDRRKVEFPTVDDIDIDGMGEIEGHYQPVLKSEYAGKKFGSLKHGVLHYAFDDLENWVARHKRYAVWEREMNVRQAWPVDPIARREKLKQRFREMKTLRPLVAFVHSYILKLGFLDGMAGLDMARGRYDYYKMIVES